MTADTPDLTVVELEQIRDATLRSYQGGDEQYETLPPHLLKVVDGDGGLVNMIDLAIHRTRQLEALRAQVQQDYAAIHTKQQRDHERIIQAEQERDAGRRLVDAALHLRIHGEQAPGRTGRELETWADWDRAASVMGADPSVDRTIVSPGGLEQMLAHDPELPPRIRDAIARALGSYVVADVPSTRSPIRPEVFENGAAHIHEVPKRTQEGVSSDRTFVPPGTIAKMRAENPGPTASFREAIVRARQRREEPNG